ncbi:MAG: hypothetical protein K6G64_06355 [Eubacterium sp.]|nr:hypothetical protein [Eubacterium sp.]
MGKNVEETKKDQNKILIVGIVIATILVIVIAAFALKKGKKSDDAAGNNGTAGNAQVQTDEKGNPIATVSEETTRIELQTTLNKKGEVITDKDGNPVKVEVVVGGGSENAENVWEDVSVFEETKGEIYITDDKGEYVTDKKGEKVTESYEGEADGWSPLVPAGDVDAE